MIRVGGPNDGSIYGVIVSVPKDGADGKRVRRKNLVDIAATGP